MDPKELAQEEAERTYAAFMIWTKRVVGWSAFFLLFVVVGCNCGVETCKGKTGSQYNGEQYSPSNLNVKDKK